MKFNQKEHLKSIARRGGLARKKIYGNPGTAAGRKLGGLRSLQTHKQLVDSPFVARKFSPPPFSEDLAEFIGILLGDGGVANYQITISLNKHDDKEYANYVAMLIEKVFGILVVPRARADKNVNTIAVSRVLLIKFLASMGIGGGSKVRNQADVPDWIKANPEFRKKCLRGLVDTDGCFYVDKHVIRGKLYKNPGINFSNRSIPLLNFFVETLLEMRLTPRRCWKYSVVLRRHDDVVRYFCEIGSSNPKHLNKFNAYLKGRVPGIGIGPLSKSGA